MSLQQPLNKRWGGYFEELTTKFISDVVAEERAWLSLQMC